MLNFWAWRSGRLNTSITVPFGSSKQTMSAIVGSGSFLRLVFTPAACGLLVEGVEIVVRPELEADA